LEKLYQDKKEAGLVVLGFPCNDFGGQEPGSNEEIMEFCSLNFGVTFPMYDKLHVKGGDQHPLYAALTGPNSPFPGNVKWNFGKFLIDHEGNIVARFGSMTSPDSKKLRSAVETALGAR
jgi:glutathione peroxidase